MTKKSHLKRFTCMKSAKFLIYMLNIFQGNAQYT